MDGLTHALFPFLTGKFFKKSRAECAALLLGGIAPDIDLFLMWIPMFFQTSLPLNHRGITHTVIFGFLTAAIVLFIASRKYFQGVLDYVFRSDIKLHMTPRLLAFAYTGLLFHLFLDWLTTRGIPLLYPLSMQRYSFELFFYIDIYLMVISAMLVGYSIFKRANLKMLPAERSKKLQKTYVAMFIVLVGALFVLGGLRLYEKGATAEHFGVPNEYVFPNPGPFEWQVADKIAGKLYDFDSLNGKILSEQNFTGEIRTRYGPRHVN